MSRRVLSRRLLLFSVAVVAFYGLRRFSLFQTGNLVPTHGQLVTLSGTRRKLAFRVCVC